MSRAIVLGLEVMAVITVALGCDRPATRSATQTPAQVATASTQRTFDTNCRGCHSQGAEGAALPLMNAEYWAVATDAVVIQAISHGQGRSMPAYLASEGGPFTQEQIVSFVQGMRTLWAGKLGSLHEGTISPLVVQGDATAGALVFAQACANCHGPQGSAGSVTDTMYLRMISDQGLWSATIYGRNDLGMPAWNQPMPQRPNGLSAQEVADVVSWISAQRSAPQKVGLTQ